MLHRLFARFQLANRSSSRPAPGPSTRRQCSSIEQLESRWTPAWAAVPPLQVTTPSNAVPAVVNNINDAQGTAAITSNEVDFYSLVPSVSGTYRISTTTSNSDLDTVLGIYDARGRRIAYNDDVSASNSNSYRALSLVAGQRYYVGITNYTGTPGGDYRWLIDGPSSYDDAYEQNDTLGTARALGTVSGTRTVSQLVMNDARDWYKFTIDSTGGSQDAVQIAFNHAQGDLDLELYDASGTRLAVAGTTSSVERISLQGRAAGTYYVRAFGFGGAGNPNYSLSISASRPSIAGGADLQGALLATGANPAWGEALTVQSAVRNAGTVAASSFQTQFWLSKDTTWSSDDIILTELNGVAARTVSSLASGATASSTVTLALPSASYMGSAASSTHYLVMRTDSANTVAETNEANNSGQIGKGYDFAPILIGAEPTSGFEITVNVAGMTTSQRNIFQQAAQRWSEVIVGDLPNATYNGRAVDDVLIDARGVAIDGAGGILGQAGPELLRSGSALPIYGVMEFDTADMAAMESDGTLLGVVIHEMGHVLGLGTIWSNLGLVQGAGTATPRFLGRQATAEYNLAFGANATGVPLENSGGEGTRDSHWAESIFGNEIMTGYVEGAGVTMPLSRVTVAALADMGYQVNMNAADPLRAVTSARTATATTSTGASTARAPAGAMVSAPANSSFNDASFDSLFAQWSSFWHATIESELTGQRPRNFASYFVAEETFA